MGYLGSVIAGALAVACVSGNGDYETMFKEFKASYEREYASAEEERERFEYFTANMDRAAVLNRANPLARFGVNVLADRSEAEMRGMRGAAQMRQRRVGSSMGAVGARTIGLLKKDWRTAGVVTAVKNQGQCGSCWSFSTTGNIEGQWALAGQPLTSLSEQELVSCDSLDDGCSGGLMKIAMVWLLTRTDGSIATDASYPYVSGTGNVPSCKLNDGKVKTGARIRGVESIPKDEMGMAEFVSTRGPASIGVDAMQWNSYKSGVMTSCSGNIMDHGVLIVGFDTTAKPAYWIVKNSWAAQWGEHGYIRIEMWKDLCGITDDPTTAIADTIA